MSAVYFDSSALVKLVIGEDGSDLARELWDGGDVLLSSRLAYPEVAAALAAARRSTILSAESHRRARQWWDRLWGSIRPVELSRSVASRGGELSRVHALSGADAVHLASAEAIGPEEVVFAAWDRRLHAAASARGLAVAPAHLD